jgi:glycosyltransferase involved in cell wall biosynthesis
MAESRTPKVALIIPAYNEEGRVGRVIQAAKASKLTNEVIVVSDGSQDRTAEVAEALGVRVVKLTQNLGKGGAMAAGVRATTAPIIVFIDADLEGLRAQHIDDIIRPTLDNLCDMSVGIFRGGRVLSDSAQWITPYLSGQRAMRRELFEGIPYIADVRMGVEVAINDAAKRRKARVIRVILRGVSNCYKETKLGFVKGVQARGKMWVEITNAKVRNRRRRPPRRSPWRQ